MPSYEFPSVAVSGLGYAFVRRGPCGAVVWVGGEHNADTRASLSTALAQAMRLDDADMCVDLSGVTFMDVSTIGALVVAGNRLRVLSRSLSVRDPSPRARRLLGLCGLERMIDEHSEAPAGPPVVTALGSWADVPARARYWDSVRPLVAREVASEEPVCVMARRVEPATSILRRRASS